MSRAIKPSWELDYYVWNGFEAPDNEYAQIIARVKTWWRERYNFIDKELNK